jgi:hypothetical protein
MDMETNRWFPTKGEGSVSPNQQKYDKGGKNMSSEKTTNYGLHQWKRDDLFLMEEFNENNSKIDEALEACALVRLKTVTLSADTTKVSIDLTDLPVDQLGELHFRISGCHSGSDLRGVQMTFNQRSSDESYLWADLAQDSEMTTDSVMPVGNLTEDSKGCHGGIKVEVELFDHGITYRSLSAAACTDASSQGCCYLGTLSMSNYLTRSDLQSVQFQMESTTLKFKSGTVFTVYGVRI